MPSQREASRVNWTSSRNTIEEINSGSLQRIADATEIMAKNYVDMQNNLDRYKRYYEENIRTIAHRDGSIRAYKAHNTRLRNKLAAKETASA